MRETAGRERGNWLFVQETIVDEFWDWVGLCVGLVERFSRKLDELFGLFLTPCDDLPWL
jgi:hypothetical protein